MICSTDKIPYRNTIFMCFDPVAFHSGLPELPAARRPSGRLQAPVTDTKPSSWLGQLSSPASRQPAVDPAWSVLMLFLVD